MCSLGPASSLIALVAFQSGVIERMVGLLVKLAFTPQPLLYSWPAADPYPLGFLPACVFVVAVVVRSSCPRPCSCDREKRESRMV